MALDLNMDASLSWHDGRGLAQTCRRIAAIRGALAADLRAQLAMLMIVPLAFGSALLAHAGAKLEQLAKHRDDVVLARVHAADECGAPVRGRIVLPRGEPAVALARCPRCLGIDERVEVQRYRPLSLHEGDVLVLCSDGLSEHVGAEDLARVVASGAAQEAAQALVDLANARGGSDNITVIVARWSRKAR